MFKAKADGKCGDRKPLLAGFVFLAAAAPFVLGSGAEEKPLQKVELLLLESNPSAMTVGLHIEIAPGWHLYWANPGDAGLAPEVTWELPAGYEAGALQYPVPEKIVSRDIVAYGFTTEVLILCEIKPAGTMIPSKPPAIACRLNWMACQESCVTGQEDMKISPEALTSAGGERSRGIMSRFAARFPKTIDAARFAAREAGLVKSGNGWQLHILLSGKGAARISDFYPYPVEDFVISHNRIAVSGGNVTIPLQPSGPSAALGRIDGLLILENDAYEISIPVKKNKSSDMKEV